VKKGSIKEVTTIWVEFVFEFYASPIDDEFRGAKLYSSNLDEVPEIVEICREMTFGNKQRSLNQIFEVRTRAEDSVIAQAQLGSIMSGKESEIREQIYF